MKTLLAATLLLSAGLALAAPPASVPHRQKPAFPVLSLPDAAAAGQRAIDLLGTRLPEVAAWYGKSADELKSLLLADRRMKVDRKGRVFYVDELEQPLATTAASPGLLDGSYAPLEQTFLLHSKPGASRTIYLNFKGATLTGTAWNSSSASIAAPAFDTDGSPGTFSTTELQRIQGIWQRVAEDYAPFDVNVTTEPPSPDQLTRSGSGDTVFGTTVLITTRAGVYNCSCGGVAYLGIFDDTSDYYKPALVFYDALGGGNEKYVAEAISHEAGHNMGLGHDGTASVGYYQGHGSGATGWAPIMGVGYYQALVQWSKGEYLDANNKQDDYTVMQGNGLPLRADDHGNSAGNGTPISNGVAVTGVIERPDDVDTFVFNANAGTATFTLSPAARSANLDAVLTLRNAAGTVLASWNPTDALNATGSVALPSAGTYSLSVSGTGKGDPLSTGYTNYGSLGQYRLTAAFGGVAGTPPQAVISASTLRGTAPLTVTFSGAGSSDSDGSIAAYQWSLGNGQSASGVSASASYTTPGSYPVQLTVTDNSGLSASTSVTVQVDAPVTTLPMRVADIAMSLVVNRGGNARADAAVRLLDGNGQPVSGAVVTGNWSGLVSQIGATATSDGTGLARFSSPTSKKSGVFVFTVTGVSATGYQYQPATNTEISDSIQR